MKLKEILKNCLFCDGDWIETKDQDPSGEIRLIQLADIGDGIFIDKSSRFINNETAKRLNCTFLKKGDILIARMPEPLGRACVFPLDGNNKYITSVDVAILRPGKNCMNNYLGYLINSSFLRHEINRQSTGTTRKRITRKRLGELQIPLPPLPIQQKIAEILDAAAALKQKSQEVLDKYDQLAQSIFLEMFGDPVSNPKGWEKVNFEKVCSFAKTTIKPQEITDGTFYVGLESIEKESGKIIEKVSVEASELKSNKFWFDKSYILYGKLRPYLNKVALPSFEGICSTDIIPILPIKNLTNKYFISQIMKNKGFVNFANERSSGANLPRISPKEIEKYKLINPPITLQNQFAQHIENIEQQKAMSQESLQQADNLFNALLQKAFKGELV